MNIRELIQVVNNTELSEAKPKVKQDAQGNWVDASTGEPAQAAAPAADNTVQFPQQGGTAEQPQAQAQEPTAGSTGDATLDQPLPPKDPNAPSFGQKAAGVLGKIGKGIGAVASVPQGLGRAIKKGYQSGVQSIGGPGAAPSAGGARRAAGSTQRPASSAARGGASGGGQQPSANVDRELDDLRQMINRVDAKLARAGIKEKKN